MTSPNDQLAPTPGHRGLIGVLKSKVQDRRSFLDYRRFIQQHYDGAAGDWTSITGVITGHETLAGRLIRPREFDVRGCKNILDAGCGNGRYTHFLLREAAPDALITAFDLSVNMLARARRRLSHSARVSHASADLTRLPYADRSFDAVVCGYVLEHLPDPRPGLRELERVLQPGGKLLLLVTEDTLTGALCSRMWHCRAHNRGQLRQLCAEVGLTWHRELWFSPLHKLLRLGGIIVEIHRRTAIGGLK